MGVIDTSSFGVIVCGLAATAAAASSASLSPVPFSSLRLPVESLSSPATVATTSIIIEPPCSVGWRIGRSPASFPGSVRTCFGGRRSYGEFLRQRHGKITTLRGGGIFGRKGGSSSSGDDYSIGPKIDIDLAGEDKGDDGGLYHLVDSYGGRASTNKANDDTSIDATTAAAAAALNNDDYGDRSDDPSEYDDDLSLPRRSFEVKATSRHLFGKPIHSIQSLIPIRVNERGQFIATSVMMFLFIYVFTTVRDTKDTLVVSHCGAEAIPFLKLYGVMPCAALFIILYSKASNIFMRETLFYATLVPFFVFYTVFAYVLYPNRDAIHFLHDNGADIGPGPFSLLRYWSFSLYFIVSELWASAGVPLLFWQCANDVTSLAQAKRFYPLFALFGNLAPILSGKVMSFLVSLQRTNDDVAFQSTLQSLATIKASICLGIIALYHLVYNLADKRARREERERVNQALIAAKKGDTVEVELKFGSKTKDVKKPTMKESMAELSKSWELKSMAIMVVCYNTCIELTEVLWKALLRKTYTNKADYMAFMASFSQTVGWVTIFMQVFASSVIRGVGWKVSALLVPLSMGGVALWFFSSVAGAEEGGTVLATALLIGTLLNVISKVTKYSLFDPCKEMAYIPLGPEAKVKGKAAVEVFGARLGRSIGSASQQLLVFATGGQSIIHSAPALGFLYITAVGFWSKAVFSLSRLFGRPKEPHNQARSVLTGHVHVHANRGEIISIEAERGNIAK